MQYKSNLIELSAAIVLKKILQQGWPFALSRLFFIGNAFLMTLILVRYNHDYLSVTPLITSGQLFLLSIAIGVMYSVAIKVGINFGSGNFKQVGKIFQASLIQSLILSLPVIVICLLASKIYIGAEQDPHLARLSQKYFTIICMGIIPCLMVNAMQQVLIGMAKAKAVLLSTVINTALFVGVGYPLVNGVASMEGLGIAGMGYAFVIANWINLVLLILYLKYEQNFTIFGLYEKNKIIELMSELKSLFKIGMPIGVQISSELATVITVTMFAGVLGMLAENQITDQYLAIVVVISFAISQTVGVLVGREFGANNIANAKMVGKVSIMLSLGIGVLVALLFNIFSELLAEVFTTNKTLIIATSTLFLINSIGVIADNIRNITTGVLRGYKYSFWPAIANSICMTGITLPLAYVLGFIAGLGIEGIYSARAIGMVLGAIAILLLYNKKMKKSAVLNKYQDDDLILSRQNDGESIYQSS